MKTPILPDKKLWADEIKRSMELWGISNRWFAKVSSLSRPTIIKALRGDADYETLETINKEIDQIIENEKAKEETD